MKKVTLPLGLIMCYVISGAVLEPPVVIPLPVVSSLEEGPPFMAFCSVSKGSEPLVFTWAKDGQDIRDLIRGIKIEKTNRMSTIMFESINRSHAGNYSCTAQNGFGKNTKWFSLSVKVKLKWVDEPKDASVVVGNQLVLKCDAEGLPAPEISWSSVKTGKTLVQGKQLVFEHVSKLIEGEYKCGASSGSSSMEKMVKVSVSVPAKFEEKYKLMEIKRGEMVRLACPAIGDQVLKVTWFKDNTKIDKRGDGSFEIFDHPSEDGVFSEMIIRSAQKQDTSTYKCVAENEYGTDERTLKVIVMEIPGPPLNVRIKEVWTTSAEIVWDPPSGGNSPVTKYIVQFWAHKSSARKLHVFVVLNAQTSAMIKDLKPGRSYELTVIAENDVGRGEPADTVTFITGPEAPSAPPIDVNVKVKGPTSIKVSWKAPPKDHWNGKLVGYYVGVKINNAQQQYSFRSHEIVPSDDPSHTYEFFFTNLLRTTTYDVVVKAYNSAGSGPPSHLVRVKTLDGELPPPVRLNLVSASKGSILLRWNRKDSATPVNYFTIHYQPENQDWRQVPVPSSLITTIPTASMPTSETSKEVTHSYTLKNLDSGTRYNIFITSSNTHGEGDPSNILVATTEGGLRDLPYFLEPLFFIPILSAFVVIFTVLMITYLWVRKMKSQLDVTNEFNTLNAKHFVYTGTTQRYVDFDKASKASMDLGNMSTATYGTSPLRKHDDQLSQHWDRASIGSSIQKDPHIYDHPQ